jgi:hypothetical protein
MILNVTGPLVTGFCRLSKSLSPVKKKKKKKNKRPMGHIAHLSNKIEILKSFHPIFSSPELKAQVSYSDRPLSVCPSVRLSVNFYIFDFFSRTTGPILTKLGTNHP